MNGEKKNQDGIKENYTSESNCTSIHVVYAGGLSHKQILINPKLKTLHEILMGMIIKINLQESI